MRLRCSFMSHAHPSPVGAYLPYAAADGAWSLGELYSYNLVFVRPMRLPTNRTEPTRTPEHPMELLASSSRQKPLRPDALTRHNRDVVASRRSHDAERVSQGEEGERKKRRGGEKKKRRRRREEEKEEKNEKRPEISAHGFEPRTF